MLIRPSNPGASLEERLNPSVERLLSLLTAALQAIRVALPAIVTKFDPETATVSVQIATAEYVTKNGGGNVVSILTQAVEIPELDDVPVQFPTAGGYSITFPIQVGDECMVIFADTPLDVWFQNGGDGNSPVSQRRHSLSDGIAVFGLRSKPRALENYSTDSMQIRSDDGTITVELKPSTINVTAPKVNVTCSDTAKVEAPNVMLGSDIKLRDFLTHVHVLGTSTTGPVF